jgi:hypothetical protein
MQNDKAVLTIEHKDGRAVREFVHEGRTYIESRVGTEYQLRLKNNTGGRVLAVVSVDGINAVSGKPVSDSPDEAGYVLAPNESHVIKGYRVDENTVASFTFVKREGSYATERGEGQGNGTIAVRFWKEEKKKEDVNVLIERYKTLWEEEKNRPREKEYIPIYPSPPSWPWRDPYYPYPRNPWITYEPSYWLSTTTCGAVGEGVSSVHAVANDTVRAFNSMAQFGDGGNVVLDNCSINSADPAQVVQANYCAVVAEAANPFAHGSSWGDAVADTVKEVEFKVGKLLTELCVYYAPLEGLKALGVDVNRTKAVVFPEPFKRGFCPPPSGWKKP